MVGSARRITVEFLGNNRDLDNAMDSSAKKGGKFGSALGKVGKVAGLGLAAGVVVAGKAMWDMTKAAAEDEASQKRLATTLKNTTGATDTQVKAVEDWISKQGVALGVTDDELRPAMQRLVTATGDVGKAQKLASLAMDISAGSGQSLESVAKALAKAQNGQVAGLSKLGIKTKESVKDTAALQAANIAVEKAQTKYNDAVNEYGVHSKEAKDAAAELEYRQTRLGEANGKVKTSTIDFAEAQERLQKAYGGQASKNANTFEGKMRRLKLVFDETKESIGAKLLPVATRLATWFLNKGLPAITAFGNYLKVKLPPIFDKIKDVVKRVMGALSGDTGSSMKEIKDFIQDAVTVIQWIWKKFGKNILGFLKDVFTGIKDVIQGAFKIIRGIFKVFSSLIKGDWKGVWKGVKLILSGAWQAIKGLVRLGLSSIKLLMKNAWVVIKEVAKKAWEGIKEIPRIALQKVIDLIKGVPGRIKALAGLYKTAAGIVMRGIINGLGDFGRAAFGKIVEAIKSIPARIRGLAGNFKDAAAHILSQLVAGFKGAGGLVSDIAGKVWDTLKGLINSAIDKINDALEFTIDLPGKDIHINPANIPHVFKGGVVPGSAKGSLIVAGDRGHDEAVIPLSGPYAPKGLGGQAPVVVNITLNGVVGSDKATVMRWIESGMRDLVRQTGRPVAFPTTVSL